MSDPQAGTTVYAKVTWTELQPPGTSLMMQAPALAVHLIPCILTDFTGENNAQVTLQAYVPPDTSIPVDTEFELAMLSNSGPRVIGSGITMAALEES